jgi:hypothetical protein
LLQMLSALERTGCTPIDSPTIHAFAFFVNVLSPLWDLEPLEGSVLKDKEGPYYPAVDRELDRLIGMQLVEVVSLSVENDNSGTRLSATFRLATERAGPLLKSIRTLPDENELAEFLLELASAFADIRPDRRDDAAVADAAYSDPAVADGRIVDFAEWVSPTRGNATWRAAQLLQTYAPPGVHLNRGEKLALYMDLLNKRASG